MAVWIVPRRYRFKAALAIARWSAPLVTQTSWYRAYRRLRVDGANEITLHYVLNILAGGGILFDPQLHVEGNDRLEASLKENRGVLVVAPHALLSLLLFRYLYDKGCVPVILSTEPSVHIYGTRRRARALQPSARVIHRVLSAGGVVCAMIDEESPRGHRTVEVPTVAGPIYISDGLLRLAHRCNAGVVFTAVRVDQQRGVVLSFGAAEPPSVTNVETITKDFVNFLQAHVATVSTGGSSDRIMNSP